MFFLGSLLSRKRDFGFSSRRLGSNYLCRNLDLHFMKLLKRGLYRVEHESVDFPPNLLGYVFFKPDVFGKIFLELLWSEQSQEYVSHFSGNPGNEFLRNQEALARICDVFCCFVGEYGLFELLGKFIV